MLLVAQNEELVFLSWVDWRDRRKGLHVAILMASTLPSIGLPCGRRFAQWLLAFPFVRDEKKSR